MNWTEVCQNKALQDLPFKEEGRLSFYSYSGEQELSTLFADFPSALVVPE